MSSLNTILAQSGIVTPEVGKSESLAKFGLDWKVEKLPLSLPNGKPSGFFGIHREDNNTTFATCKEGYEVFQNSELFDLASEAAGQLGYTIDNGGLFKQGALVHVQISTGRIAGLGKNNDTVQKFVTAINSHDGSTSLRWGSTNITISCQNTFWSAFRSLQNAAKHTESMRARIEATMKGISQAIENEKTLYETFFKLADVPAKKNHVELVTKLVLGVDLNKKPDDISTYKKNRLAMLSADLNSEMKQKGETLWGLFSGVTRYTTHDMPGGDENRETAKAVGMGYRIDNEVFSKLADFVA